MLKFHRDVERLCTDNGVEVVAREVSRHCKWRLRNQRGDTAVLVTAVSPSDNMALMSIRSRVRRFAREGRL